ncbi:MAG: protease modulator HflK [Planctomycetota bacterium]|nr:MAG: protease modulator HflK [Planctomycetota bacterium]REJ88399.1 MAG: protease modulator HflK [Planctomycetota bacterium]REK30639.1 MAG: protease modulator HflK [Planctomycetota bacterium]REK33013.1 MAG: protease modulator HflK [Planctomycetota bacterium]
MNERSDSQPAAETSAASSPAKRRQGLAIAHGVASGLKLVGWFAALLFVLFWCSGITVIQPGEVGLVLRLGRLQGQSPADQVKQPGLLLAWPYPIDEVLRVPVKQEREIRIEDLAPAGIETQKSSHSNGYALSGDQNLVQAQLTAKYRITDPVAYQLHQSDPERTIRDVVTSAAAQTICRWDIDSVLRLQRAEGDVTEDLASTVRRLAQERLDELRCGAQLTTLEFREIQPPDDVADAFRAVQSERIAIETKKREAEGVAARMVPEAEAERNTLVQDATRHATDLRTRAEEEVALLSRLHSEYSRNPHLVWNRLHLETVEQTMRQAGSFRFVDPGTRLILTPAGLAAPDSDATSEDSAP